MYYLIKIFENKKMFDTKINKDPSNIENCRNAN